MNTLYLQMETETLLNNFPMGLSNYSMLHKNIYAWSYFL